MSSGSVLEQEIAEQPEVLARRAPLGQAAAAEAGRILTRSDVTHLVVAARGSSDNAARYAQYLLGRTVGLSVYLATPSLFPAEAGDVGAGPSLGGAAVLGISQSGQSPDVVGVLAAARRQGRPTIALTNDAASPLAHTADVVVPLLTGVEQSVAATKTYTATMQALIQLAMGAGATSLRDGLIQLPDLMESVTTSALAIDFAPSGSSSNPLATTTPLTAVGRGTGFATASETALKIREVAGIRAEPYAVPDLLHGPISANGPESQLWVIASPDYPVNYWNALTRPLADAGVQVAAVVPEEGADIFAHTRHVIPAGLPGWLFDFVAVVFGQVAALRLGERRGLDVDHPRGLAKVTLTH